MAYVVDRVVICDAFQEPERHYQLLTGGRSKLAEGRRPWMRFLASAKDVKGGIAGVVGREAGLFEDLLASSEQRNDFVIQLRDEVRAWRWAGYPGTAAVTRRLLEWWFERDDERSNMRKRYSSEKEASDEGGWRHTRVVLSPTNPEYSPIILSKRDAEPVQVVGEFVTVLRGT